MLLLHDEFLLPSLKVLLLPLSDRVEAGLGHIAKVAVEALDETRWGTNTVPRQAIIGHDLV